MYKTKNKIKINWFCIDIKKVVGQYSYLFVTAVMQTKQFSFYYQLNHTEKAIEVNIMLYLLPVNALYVIYS